MSVSIMEIGRSTNGSQMPKEKYVEPFGEITDKVNLPFNVLWEQARSGITKMVHFSFKNLHQILGQAEMEIVPQPNDLLPASIPRSSMSLNSRIISASFGRGRKIQFPGNVEISLQHLEEVDPLRPAHSVCTVWDAEQSSWSNLGCNLVTSNATSSTCRCSRLGYTALITAPNADGSSSPTTLPVMTLQIVTYIVAAISVLCVLLILVKVSSCASLVTLEDPHASANVPHISFSSSVPSEHPQVGLGGAVPEQGGETRMQSATEERHQQPRSERPANASGIFTHTHPSFSELNK